MTQEKTIIGKCPVCNRDMIEGCSVNEHHLKPKSLKGKEKIMIHKVCHQKIHTLFTERELLNHYYSIERIKEHEEIQKFVKWVQKFEPEFYDRSKTSNRKKSIRKK